MNEERPLDDIAPDVLALAPDLQAVLESAARLQEVVPGAVLVGGSAAALYAGHRASFDHDHVVTDLRDRFEMVLDAVEREGQWITNRVRPGRLILGQIGDIETGVRQLIRTTPLETQQIGLPSGRPLTVPTAAETLRIKGFLVVKRNQVRDYLDVVGLSVRYGLGPSAFTLAHIDEFYADQRIDGTAVAEQLIRQLAEPQPADREVVRTLGSYKQLAPRWHRWSAVTEVCADLAERIITEEWG